MVDFDNVKLSYQNCSEGPESGYVYSIDHVSDSLIVKTNPGGTLVTTFPLDYSIQNEVRSLQYDGYYFWSLSKIGLNEDLGIVINKWEIKGSILEKKTGAGNEIILLTNSTNIYDSEAMTVRFLETELDVAASSGTNQIVLDSSSFLQINDEIFIGPSTYTDELENKIVTGISGTTITLNSNLNSDYTSGDSVKYRKDIWVFNNYNYTDSTVGSLLQLHGNLGYIIAKYSGFRWSKVTAAACRNGNLAFVRNSQYLEYKPFGVNAGYQTSLCLNNVGEGDGIDVIKVYDILIDDTSVHKLQTRQHYFDTITEEWIDIDSTVGYNLDREFFTPSIKGIAAIRNNSILFGELDIDEFIIQVLDQYNVPVFSRSLSITEDDISGLIEPGYESITTDVNGLGISKYNTGTSPDFSITEIKIRDNVTGLNLKFNLIQTPYTDNKGFVEQIGDITNKIFVEQDLFESRLTLEQDIGLESFKQIEQRADLESRKPINQVLQDSILTLEQVQKLQSDILLEQQAYLEEYTTIQQYDFLIFAIPEPYSAKNSPSTDILVRIVGFGAIPLDPSTLIFKVNNIDISSNVIITAFAGGLELFYDPSEDFPYSSTVSIYIEIQDTDSPTNTIFTSYTFDIVNDSKKPFLHQVYPPNNSINNNEDTQVYAIIKDLETGIDLDSIEMFVEGKKVVTTITELDENTVKVLYEPNCNFPYEADISASVSASDNEGNKFVGSWSFIIKNSAGVLFINTEPENCSVLVPIDSNICTQIFGLKDGICINSLEFDVDGKKIDYVIKPKIYRKE